MSVATGPSQEQGDGAADFHLCLLGIFDRSAVYHMLKELYHSQAFWFLGLLVFWHSECESSLSLLVPVRSHSNCLLSVRDVLLVGFKAKVTKCNARMMCEIRH